MNQKVVGNSYSVHATVAPVGMPCCMVIPVSNKVH